MCFFCERKHHQLLFVFLCITSYPLDCHGYHHSHQLVLVPKERWIASVETKYLMGSSDGAKGWLEQVCWGAEGTISWEVVVFLSRYCERILIFIFYLWRSKQIFMKIFGGVNE